ncbi:hypothetical protein ACCO45_001669 [Purpureocillium lilacinum]|uniref:Uncharacterized protein n=1 Tax=Purpureocillium lilacinum TaxID=33203 RepID=A0ACC4E7N3_PURLI
MTRRSHRDWTGTIDIIKSTGSRISYKPDRPGRHATRSVAISPVPSRQLCGTFRATHDMLVPKRCQPQQHRKARHAADGDMAATHANVQGGILHRWRRPCCLEAHELPDAALYSLGASMSAPPAALLDQWHTHRSKVGASRPLCVSQLKKVRDAGQPLLISNQWRAFLPLRGTNWSFAATTAPVQTKKFSRHPLPSPRRTHTAMNPGIVGRCCCLRRPMFPYPCRRRGSSRKACPTAALGSWLTCNRAPLHRSMFEGLHAGTLIPTDDGSADVCQGVQISAESSREPPAGFGKSGTAMPGIWDLAELTNWNPSRGAELRLRLDAPLRPNVSALTLQVDG